MEITQQVRDYAARLNEQQTGMEQMSRKFREMGGEVYIDEERAKAANKTLR